MHYIGPIAVIVGALICLSGFIIAKKPDLKHLFEKIAPFQGFLGVGLLAWGLYALYYYFVKSYGGDSIFMFLIDHPRGDKLAAISLAGYVVSEIIIGFILGFGLIANWIPGESAAEKKGLEIQRKLLGLSIPIGAIGLASAILWMIKMPSGMP
jgi:hypothetical protein